MRKSLRKIGNDYIGQIILNQMKAMDANLLMCIAFESPTLVENGLRFKVNGFLHKGLVEINLNGRDLYDVKIIKVKRQINEKYKSLGIRHYDTIFNTISESNNLYAEDLMSELESKIERS